MFYASQEGFDVGQILWPGDFGVGVGADDELDGLANQFTGSGVVGYQQPALARYGQGAPEGLHTKGLRSLHGPKARAVKGPLNQFAVTGLLDRIGNGLG